MLKARTSGTAEDQFQQTVVRRLPWNRAQFEFTSTVFCLMIKP